MENLFLRLFDLSVQAGILTLVVLAARAVTARTRTPKAVRCLMWALVGLRLVCPFSVKSAVSLLPEREVISVESKMAAKTPKVLPDGGGALGGVPGAPEPSPETSSPAVSPSGAVPPAVEDPAAESAPGGALVFWASRVWLAGVAALLAYFVVSALALRRRVSGAVRQEDGVWESEAVPSPFVFGVIRPKIYLPAGLEPRHREYVLAHERAHIRRRDHLFKPLAFLILAVYWFNPLMWLAYVLLTRDIELACDERVLSALGPGAKKPYSQALLAAVTFHRNVAACPVAFGEGKLTSRVKNVLRWKRPVVWVTAISLLLCVVLGACFLTEPKGGEGTELSDGDLAGDYKYTGEIPEEQGPNVFGITLLKDHTFSYYETIFSSHIGFGSWEYRDGVVTLTEETWRLVNEDVVEYSEGVRMVQGGELEKYEKHFRFLADGESLTYIAQDSDGFMFIDVADGDVFLRSEKAPGEGFQYTEDPSEDSQNTDNSQKAQGISWRVEDGVLTISGSGPMEDYTLKEVETPEGYIRVSTAPWSAMAADITSAVMEEGVTTVGSFAFYGLENMESVSIPAGVTSLGSGAFENSGLRSASLPQGVSKIGSDVFAGCGMLSEVDLPDSVTEMGFTVFRGCAALEHIRIPAGMTEIGVRAFEGSGITEAVIPSTVTSIAHSAFSGCERLRSVTIPSSVRTIGEHAFSGCGALESVEMAPGVESIGDYAFAFTYALRDIVLPEGLLEMGNEVFSGAGLYSASVPASVGFRSYGAPFFYCHFLTDIYYGGTVEQLSQIWDGLNPSSSSSDAPSVTIHLADGTQFPAKDGLPMPE